MPANRMNAPTGSLKLNVIGSSSATVRAGPIPGSTPTSVPSVTPAAASNRFSGVRTCPKPSIRLAAKSSNTPGPRRQLHVEPLRERVRRHHAEQQGPHDAPPGPVGAEQPGREPEEDRRRQPVAQ